MFKQWVLYVAIVIIAFDSFYGWSAAEGTNKTPMRTLAKTPAKTPIKTSNMLRSKSTSSFESIFSRSSTKDSWSDSSSSPISSTPPESGSSTVSSTPTKTPNLNRFPFNNTPNKMARPGTPFRSFSTSSIDYSSSDLSDDNDDGQIMTIANSGKFAFIRPEDDSDDDDDELFSPLVAQQQKQTGGSGSKHSAQASGYATETEESDWEKSASTPTRPSLKSATKSKQDTTGSSTSKKKKGITFIDDPVVSFFEKDEIPELETPEEIPVYEKETGRGLDIKYGMSKSKKQTLEKKEEKSKPQKLQSIPEGHSAGRSTEPGKDKEDDEEEKPKGIKSELQKLFDYHIRAAIAVDEGTLIKIKMVTPFHIRNFAQGVRMSNTYNLDNRNVKREFKSFIMIKPELFTNQRYNFWVKADHLLWKAGEYYQMVIEEKGYKSGYGKRLIKAKGWMKTLHKQRDDLLTVYFKKMMSPDKPRADYVYSLLFAAYKATEDAMDFLICAKSYPQASNRITMKMVPKHVLKYARCNTIGLYLLEFILHFKENVFHFKLESKLRDIKNEKGLIRNPFHNINYALENLLTYIDKVQRMYVDKTFLVPDHKKKSPADKTELEKSAKNPEYMSEFLIDLFKKADKHVNRERTSVKIYLRFVNRGQIGDVTGNPSTSTSKYEQEDEIMSLSAYNVFWETGCNIIYRVIKNGPVKDNFGHNHLEALKYLNKNRKFSSEGIDIQFWDGYYTKSLKAFFLLTATWNQLYPDLTDIVWGVTTGDNDDDDYDSDDDNDYR